MRHQSLFPLAVLAALAATLLASPAARPQDAAPDAGAAQPAQAALDISGGVNLNITPRRVTLDRQTRTATVYIYNQGETETAFDIALVDRVMLPDGRIRGLDEAQADAAAAGAAQRLQSASGFVVAAPRRVTLAPGRGQTIRLRANPPPDAAPGEYRTHLTVTNIPPPDSGLTAEQAAAAAEGDLVFRIQSIFGISIPVIVRTAAPDVRARIENPMLTRTEVPATDDAPAGTAPALRFDIVREGPNSVFGNIEIRSGGEAEPLGVARGMGVYPEIERRSATIALSREPRPGEALSVVLIDDDTDPGRELARAAFPAP